MPIAVFSPQGLLSHSKLEIATEYELKGFVSGNKHLRLPAPIREAD